MPTIEKRFLSFHTALPVFYLLLLTCALLAKPLQANDTAQTPAVGAVCSNKTILFVGSSRPLLPRDAPLVTHLASLGYKVVVRTDKEVLAKDAVGKNLIIISESVLSTNVNTKLRNVAVPLLTWEGWVLDDLQMTGPVAYTDYGEVLTETKIRIVDPSHPLAAGLSGDVETVAINDQVNNKFHWGVPSQAAHIVATEIGAPDHAYIYAYETGAQMVGMLAPARRIGIQNATGPYLTAAGWAIFDAAVNWAIDCSANPTATPPPSATPPNTPTATNSPTATKIPQTTPPATATATAQPTATPTTAKTAVATPPAATPTPSSQSAHLVVTLTDFLFDDVDHNNVVSSGDKLLYVIGLKNDGTGPAEALRIDDTLDPNTTLIVGSIQANQGAVNKGNHPGDTQVSIAYGALAPGSQTIISLQATVNAGPQVTQVENQAVVTLTNPNGGPGGQTVVLSDDPDTSQPVDVTITGLNGNQPQPHLKVFMPIVTRPK